MTMGTASTMGSMVEALGMALPHNAAIPAVDARRYALAHMSGKRIVEMVKENLIMSRVVQKASFENAIKVNGAIGGSTNAVIHLAAVAGRLEIDLSLDDWETCGKDIPTLVNLQPSGKYLMEDFYYAGGVPAVIKQLLDKNLLNKDALTVNGKTIEENNLNAEDISEKLSSLAAEKILDNIDDIYEDKANFIEQDHSSATYASKIQKLEGQINWKEDAKIIIGKINGLYPVPGAYFMFNGERYKILKAEIGQAQGKPGEVLSDHLEISCGDKKSIKIKEIQRQGKKPQSIGEFVLGTQIKKGSFI